MRGALILFALSGQVSATEEWHGSAMALAGAQEYNPTCFAGTIQGPGGNDMTKSQVVDALDGAVQAATARVMESNVDFRLFMNSRGSCQHSCMGSIMRSSISALVGKLGPNLMHNSSVPLAIEALTGAFKACYPSPPREHVVRVVTDVVEGIVISGVPNPSDSLHLSQNSCPNEARGYEFPIAELRTRFEFAFRHVLALKSDVREFFDTKALTCQSSCIRDTVPQAMLTLFLNNNTRNETLVLDSVTGAVKACFPGVPHALVRDVVSETIFSIQWPQADQSCFHGSIQGPGGNTLTQSQVVDLVDNRLQAATTQVMNSNIEFKMFMETRGSCQHSCMASVMRTGIGALFGKLGPEILTPSHDSSRILATDALTGAFKACYPSPPREQVLRVVTAVLQNVNLADPNNELPYLHLNHSCPNAAKGSEFPIEDFKQEFQTAIRRIIASKPAAQEYFLTRAKTCQVDCMVDTVAEAARTLFINNEIQTEALQVEAFRGAVRTCFPDIHSAALPYIVTEAVNLMRMSPAHTTFPPDFDQSCFDGTVQGPNGDSLTSTQVVDAINAQVQASALRVMESNRSFRVFMDTRGDCQHRCFNAMTKTTMATMLGKLGRDVLSNSSRPLVTQALTGAFKACYPGRQCRFSGHNQDLTDYAEYGDSCMPADEQILQVVSGYVNGPVNAHVGPADPAGLQMNMGNACPNNLREAEFPHDEFRHELEIAFVRVASARPSVAEFFETRAKTCQVDCLRQAVPQAAFFLFLDDKMNTAATNSLNTTYALISLTGAVVSCYPGVPHETVMDVVSETLNVFMASRTNVYNGHVRTGQLYDATLSRFGSVPMFGFAAAMVMAAALFVAGATVIRRMRSPAAQESDSLLVIEEGRD